VKIIQLFDFPIRDSNDREFLVGCAAITFNSISSAESCCKLFSEGKYKNRKLYARLIVPDRLSGRENQEIQGSNTVLAKINGEETVPHRSDVIYDEATLKEVEDVEDFLNSLL
jgi:hypothetical protein